MNYLSIYNMLVEKRKTVPIVEEYSEVHHILPKCLGGDDSKDNLVRLTAREHFIAHQLLYKHYRTPALAHAWYSMLRCDQNQKRNFTSRQHEVAKRAHIETLKVTMAGENNSFYGRKHSDETRNHISEKVKDWYSTNDISQEKIDNWIEKVAKKPASDKQKAAASASSKGKIMLKNINTGETVKVDKTEKMLYDDTIWKNPAAISQKKDTCIHCGLTSVAGNIKRWHNDNCKKKVAG